MSEAMVSRVEYELPHALPPLAEHLDQQLATEALRKYETRKNPNGLLHSAWSYAEFALNAHDIQQSGREEHFHTSRLLTSMVVNHPKVGQDTLLGALTLSTYVPLFSKRAFDSEVDAQDCEDVYRSLGMAMNYLRPLDIDEPPQWRMAEIGVLALSA